MGYDGISNLDVTKNLNIGYVGQSEDRRCLNISIEVRKMMINLGFGVTLFLHKPIDHA